MPKISALPAMTTADGDDPAPIVDDSAGSTKKITLNKMKEWLQSLTGWLSRSNVDWSTFTNNMKIAYNTAASPSGSGETNLAGNGLSISLTVASNTLAMIEVTIACSSTSDFEFYPRVYVDGVLSKSLTPVAAPGFAGNRATMRTVKNIVTLSAGAHTITGRIFASSGTSLSIPANGAFISVIAFGDVTA